MTGEALAPLRARYATWLGLDAEQVRQDREEAAEDIRAMQLLLRMERSNPPSWHAAAALAAQGAAAVCLVSRSAPGGEWFEAVSRYCQGHIRKVTRRGRGAQWDATATLPGLTLLQGDTEIRVLVPGPVGELDKRVAKLQVGGTDVEIDPAPAAAPDGALQIWINPDHVMTLGKTMAQTGHAGMIAGALLADSDPAALQSWYERDLPTAVRVPSATEWATRVSALTDPAAAWADDRLLAVRDAGFTEVPPGTITVLAAATG